MKTYKDICQNLARRYNMRKADRECLEAGTITLCNNDYIPCVFALMNTAKCLNKEWLPDFETNDEKYYFALSGDKVQIESSIFFHTGGVVYFKTEKKIRKALKILGNKKIVKALKPQ